MILQTVPVFQYTPEDCRYCNPNYVEDHNILSSSSSLTFDVDYGGNLTDEIPCECPPQPLPRTARLLDWTINIFAIEIIIRLFAFSPSMQVSVLKLNSCQRFLHYMKFLFFVLAVNFTLADNKWGQPEDEHVVVLTNSNFQGFIESYPKVFVKFYAPWCGHCKAMAPDYSKLAERMKTDEDGIPIAKVDATVEKDLAEKYQVQGFPALKMFINGEPVEYGGERTEDAIYEWIKTKTDSQVKELKTLEEYEEFKKNSLAVLMTVSEDDDESVKKY